MLHLLEVDTVSLTERAVDQGSEVLGELQGAEEASEAGDVSRKGDL